MGRYVNDPKNPELLYIADNYDDLQLELPKIEQVIKWGNNSLVDSGFDQHLQDIVVRGLKVFLKLRNTP